MEGGVGSFVACRRLVYFHGECLKVIGSIGVRGTEATRKGNAAGNSRSASFCCRSQVYLLFESKRVKCSPLWAV